MFVVLANIFHSVVCQDAPLQKARAATDGLSAMVRAAPRAFASHLFTQVSHVSSTRPERAVAPSPGHRPGLLRTQTCRPVRAKALKIQAIYKAFALTGRLADCYYTQGDALG